MEKNVEFLMKEKKAENEKAFSQLPVTELENDKSGENSKKLEKKNNNKLKIDIHHLLIYSLFSLSITYYYLGLRGCETSFEECQANTDINVYIERGFETAYSSVLFSFAIFFISYFKKKFIHILIFISIYVIIFITTQGNDFIRHGTYNCILFLAFIVICWLYINGCYYIIKSIRGNKKHRICAIIIAFFLIFPFAFYFIRTRCVKWNYGLGNIEIEYDINIDGCKIKNPNKCTIGMFWSLFDLSAYLKRTCKGNNNDKKTFEKYLNDSQKKFNKYSYPDTSEFGDNYLSFTEEFANMVEKKIWGYDEETNNKEVTVEFTNGIGKINIQVKRKEKLVEERKKLYENNTVQFENIYIIYIDALSLQHFKRKLPKTRELIEKMLYTNKNKEEFFEKYEAFQFVKYHNLGINTVPNILPLFYGNFLGVDKGIFIGRYLKEKGFITGCEHNSCNRGIFDFPPTKLGGVKVGGFDHENFGLFCDTNYNDKLNSWSAWKGRNSKFRKCLYNEQTSKYMKDYFLDFCEKYKNERKYFSTIFTDGHEGTLELVKYIDDDVHDLILEILTKYFDDKSIIFIISDHGPHMPWVDDVLLSEQKRIENLLGLFLMILPNNTNLNKEIIHQNEQALVTPLDIYNTFLDIIKVNKSILHHSMLGESVFKKLDRKNRNCQSLNISAEHCKCE